MRRILYTGRWPTAHPEAGVLAPGVNEIADDALAGRLLEAGLATGDFLPVEEKAFPEAAIEAEIPAAPPPRRARKEKEE